MKPWPFRHTPSKTPFSPRLTICRYPLLASAQLAQYGLVLPPEGSRVNLGFLYVRGTAISRRGGAPARS